MLNRRELLERSAKIGIGVTVGGLSDELSAGGQTGTEVNDVQSQLNATRVRNLIRPHSVDDVVQAVQTAKRQGLQVSVAGGRHSMGGQQFGTDNVHLDMTGFNAVIALDRTSGLVTVESGIQWPKLIEELHRLQPTEDDGYEQPWTIREKQTGVDTVTIAGSLASNIHGRGLKSAPFVSDIESFAIVDADGTLRHCSRNENAELFSLAIGGYGLFGIVTHVTLRLVRRFKVRRHVDLIEVRNLLDRYRDRRDEGFVFGDCQYSIDLGGDSQSHPGIMPCYEPVEVATPISSNPVELSAADWGNLYRLVRTDKRRAFEIYAQHYLRTDGQVYWSDTHQLAGAFNGHRDAVDATQGTEMITEVYLRHDRVMDFMGDVRERLVERGADISYGTIRFIEPDCETFLPWAREQSVCIVCNLFVPRETAGMSRAKQTFRMILDRAVDFGGSFYLTYHRWARPHHIRAAYPGIHEFFRLKRSYDPEERFQSDWYRHYSPAFA